MIFSKTSVSKKVESKSNAINLFAERQRSATRGLRTSRFSDDAAGRGGDATFEPAGPAPALRCSDWFGLGRLSFMLCFRFLAAALTGLGLKIFLPINFPTFPPEFLGRNIFGVEKFSSKGSEERFSGFRRTSEVSHAHWADG
jgi:hypothetical protein